MHFRSNSQLPRNTDCIVVGMYTSKKLVATKLPKDSKDFITYWIDRGETKGDIGESMLLRSVPGLAVDRVLVVGVGGPTAAKAHGDGIAKSIAHTLGKTTTTNVGFLLGNLKIDKIVPTVVTDLIYQLYQYTRTKKSDKLSRLKTVCFVNDKPDGRKLINKEIARASAIAAGVNLARDLGNTPSNICTPGYLGKQAQKLAKKSEAIKTTVLSETQMRRLKMNSLLSVSAGSKEPAKLVVLEYKGDKRANPYALVGKGVTFDSGGISLKPGAAMDEMKFDMCGAASVLGVFRALAEIKPKINVVGVIPATENMPGPKATKPGDVVTSMSGQTIEILNTDAEGRLILCDALSYVGKYKPVEVVDIATLTGACIIALGKNISGLIANDDKLARELEGAGMEVNDKVWRLPLSEEYDKQLDSNFADMANIGGREAGTITAGCFLARFANDYRWAHLDIAGTAWKSGKGKGATGRPVKLLLQYLLNKVS